uniref:Capsid protein n=1 Tax=Giant panda feces-associated gemycircularvirus TaxID=2864014 RepID=A0A8K1HJ34_9VIRU|nr:capsid protein [Giant panda feces-associated gemycircularvirus]
MPRYRKQPQLKRRLRKAVLNATTFKKRDTMITTTNATTSGPSTTYTNSPAIITANTSTDTTVNHPTVFLWCATARDLTDSNSVPAARENQTTRTSTTPYMKGLAEKIEIQTSSGAPWQWRRICFTYKGSLPGAAQTTTFSVFRESNTGYGRMLNSPAGNRNGGAQYDLFFLLFRGQNSTDWMDPMTARTDPTRVSIKYDKTVTVAAGNESGCIRKYSRYHPMEKTLVYDDDESGPNMSPAYYSTQGMQGMGDYYIVDMIRSRYGAGSSDVMVFGVNSTLYWHEK